MMNRYSTLRVLLLALCALLLSTAFAAPKNIILLIGDGMGPDSVYAAGAYKFGNDYHLFGGKEKMTMETLRHHLYVTTHSSNGHGYDFGWAGGNKDYVKTRATDSAAAGTAMATGVKTYDAAIAVDMDKRPLTTILEIAKGRGMKTGVISSVPFSHATPAAFAAHNEHRNNYTAITHDMIFNVQPDVIMGAGHPDGAQAGKEYEYIRKEDWEALRGGNTPYALIQDREEFTRLVTEPRVGKIFGAYRNHFCLKYCGADRSLADPNLPTLAEMAEGALQTLNNPKGFFVMIEGGAIDWCNHAVDINGSVGETLAFDETVEAVLEWIARNGGWEQNLLIVTADHDTGYMNSVQPTGKGKLPTVQWGTGDKPWTSHTNRLVPAYYQGAGADLLSFFARETVDFERGKIRYIDNTDIFTVMNGALRQRDAQAQEGVGREAVAG
jgi:alkaline phosphatase